MRSTIAHKINDAYRRLKDAILNGAFKPGEPLKEEAVSQFLNISRNTVRLVLARLEDEELVESEPFKGKRVAKLTIQAAREILEARKLLEGATARLAAERVTDSQLTMMGAILHAMDAAKSTGDYDGYSRLNGEFHQVIFDAANNSVVARILLDLKTRLVRFQYRTVLVPGRSDQSYAEHIAIYEALRNHDSAMAETAMQTHVLHVWETIRDHQKMLDIGGDHVDEPMVR